MICYTRFIFGAAVCVVACLSTSLVFSEDLSRAKELFVQHMRMNSPITGEFILRGKIGEDFSSRKRRESVEASAEQRGLSVEYQPDTTVLTCRWSWDGTRELMQPIGKKNNIWRAFFYTRKGLLDGNTPTNYNLVQPHAPYPIRPGSFYHCFASKKWPSVIENGLLIEESPELIAMATRVGPDGRVFGVKNGQTSYLVATSKHDGHLLIAEGYWDGKLARRLLVEAIDTNDDGRVFPINAIIETYSTANSKLIRTVSLESIRIEFPTTPNEIERSMEMVIPKGAEVYDLMLDKKTVLSNPTLAQAIISGGVTFIPLDVNDIKGVDDDGSWSLFLWGNVLLVLFLFVWVILRRWGVKAKN